MNIYLLTSCLGIFALICIEATDNSNPRKRNLEEISYSYAATDIGSKSGTRIKTITVIKNKKHRSLKIDPELHKNEGWGSEFRDAFDKYGQIPDFPDVFNKDGKEESSQQNKPNETPPINGNKKELIPIYEEPDESEASSDDVTEEPNVQMPAETTQVVPTEEQVTTIGVLEKLPEDIELIDIRPINMQQAKQSAKSQALHFKRFPSQEREHEEYLQRSPMSDYLQSLNPLLSKNYNFQPEQTNSPIVNQRQIYKPHISAESNTQNIFNKFPNVKHTTFRPMSTTTVVNSYNVLSKTIQFPKGFQNSQSRSTLPDPDIYIAPAIKAMLTTVKPLMLVHDSRSTSGTKNNQYVAQRSRGLRY